MKDESHQHRAPRSAELVAFVLSQWSPIVGIPTVYTVDYKERCLCVRHDDTDTFKPIAYKTWYAVKECPRSDVEHIIGRPAYPFGNGGRYACRTADYPNGYAIDLPLAFGGNTKPIAFERSDLPCPKVRKGIETRYRNGRWEKYLKTQGWVPA